MYDEFEHEDDQWRPEKPRYQKILAKAFSVFFTLFVFFLIGLVTFRLIASKPPKEMKQLLWDQSLVEICAQSPDTEIQLITSYDSFSEDGMFSVYSIYYIPALEQIQFTVRYNNRVLNYLEEDHPGAKQTEGEIYRYRLRDDHGKFYTDYSYVTDSKMGYTYRRLIFSGISLKDVSAVYVDVYYHDDYAPTLDPRHTMYVYRYDFAVNKVYDADIRTEAHNGILQDPFS